MSKPMSEWTNKKLIETLSWATAMGQLCAAYVVATSRELTKREIKKAKSL